MLFSAMTVVYARLEMTRLPGRQNWLLMMRELTNQTDWHAKPTTNVEGTDWTDWLACKADYWCWRTDLTLPGIQSSHYISVACISEGLRGLRCSLWAQSPGYRTISQLEVKDTERWSALCALGQDEKRPPTTNNGSVSKATSGKLL